MGAFTENNTLVLVFARSAQSEMEHKPIAQGASLFDTLTEQTLKTAQKTGLDVVHLNETLQVGATFGEKFTNALKRFFALGYQQIIAVGNDAPELKKHHILTALKRLDKKNMVVGPDKDGGCYLLGIHTEQFCAAKFRQLPWQTARTATALMRLASEQGSSVFQLARLLDINTTKDLYRYVSVVKKASGQLLAAILLILRPKPSRNPYVEQLVTIPHGSIPFNKGSPRM